MLYTIKLQNFISTCHLITVKLANSIHKEIDICEISFMIVNTGGITLNQYRNKKHIANGVTSTITLQVCEIKSSKPIISLHENA